MSEVPVEVTTRFATSVGSLQEAFAFVMDRVERVGDSPVIEITPFWSYGGSGDGVRGFTVVVSGMVKEETDG